MSDHAVQPVARKSFNTIRGTKSVKCVTCGIKLQKSSKSRFRSINIFSSDKGSSNESDYCSGCQNNGDGLDKRRLSFSSQSGASSSSKSKLKDPLVSMHDFFQRPIKNSFPTVMSLEAYEFYSIMKDRLSFAFEKSQDEKRCVPTLLRLMIHHSQENPVRNSFYEILSKYPAAKNPETVLIDDVDVASLLVAAIKYLPSTTHVSILDAIFKIAQGDGFKVINYATFFLQKHPQDVVVQKYFLTLLKKGIDTLTRENSPDMNIEKLRPNIESLIQADFSNLQNLKDVVHDCIGTCLNETLIFKEAFSILREKKFDYIINVYYSNIHNERASKKFLATCHSLSSVEKENMIPVLLSFSQLLSRSQEDLRIIQFHLRQKADIDKRSLPTLVDWTIQKLQENPTKVELTVMGCEILIEVGIPQPMESRIFTHICTVMDSNPNNFDLKRAVCEVLSLVECQHNIVSAMLVLHQVTMYHEMNELISTVTLSAFAKITSTKENAKVFYENVAIDDVLSVQCRFPNNLQIEEKYCTIVSNLLDCQRIEKKYAVALITHMINSIRRFSQGLKVQEASYNVLASLSNQFIEEFLGCDIVGLVVMGMITHTDISKIQEAGCLVLANVSPFIDIYQFGGIECILIAMAKHSDKKDVQYAACRALSVLYERRHIEVMQNTSVVKPLVEASKLTFPHECGDIVDRITKTILALENPQEVIGGLNTELEDPILAPDQILAEGANMDYAHTVIFVGSDQEMRVNTIKQLVQRPEGECFRLRKKKDDFGMMDYVWYPHMNNAHQANIQLSIKILDLPKKVPPRLFFSQQATYVLLWDVEKTFKVETRRPCGYESDDQEDAHMKNSVNNEADFRKGIDENIMYWTDLIHEVAPNSEIFCLGVCKNPNYNVLEDREKYHMVRMRFEEVNFQRMSMGTSFSRANIVFEVAGGSILYGKDYNIITGLKNRILISAQNEQETDVFMYDPISKMGTNQVIQTVKQIGRKDVIMRWQTLLRSIRDKLKGKDTSMDVALHILLSRGEIRTFKVSVADKNKEEIVVLNKDWLIEKARCMAKDEYQALKLSVEETKEDLSYKYEENNFCKICVNCPVISSEDSLLLWNSMESENKSPFAIKCLEQILSKVGVLIPLKSSKIEESEKLFFIPSLLKSGEPPGWSFKSKDATKRSATDLWALKNADLPSLALELWTFILKMLYLDVERGKYVNESNRNKPIWCTPHSTRYNETDTRFVIQEVCCWKTCALFKIDVESFGIKSGKVKHDIVEILFHFSYADSPLCLASKSLEKGEARFSICCKGSKQLLHGPGSTIYERFFAIAEKVIRKHKDIEHRHEIACPDCLEEYPVADVAVLDWLTMVSCDHEIVTCHRNHCMEVGIR